MALDTQTKRRSMIGIPGIGTLPVADLSIDNSDRRHIVDVYAAFPSVTDTFFFWRKRATATPAWVQGAAPNDVPFVASKHGTGTWVRDQDYPEE